MLAVEQTIGELVREARITAGLNQVDVAQAAGITQGYLSSIECGKEPTITVLRKIADAIGVPVASLIPE